MESAMDILHVVRRECVASGADVADKAAIIHEIARLPSLIGFMVLGILLGPSVLGLFYEGNLEALSFI